MERPKKILLCSLRFWHGAGNDWDLTTPTLRKSVRSVARRQGVTPKELDRAEAALYRDGLLERYPGKGKIAFTAKGAGMSRSLCQGVALPPWDWESSYRLRLDGAARRKKRK